MFSSLLGAAPLAECSLYQSITLLFTHSGNRDCTAWTAIKLSIFISGQSSNRLGYTRYEDRETWPLAVLQNLRMGRLCSSSFVQIANLFWEQIFTFDHTFCISQVSNELCVDWTIAYNTISFYIADECDSLTIKAINSGNEKLLITARARVGIII